MAFKIVFSKIRNLFHIPTWVLVFLALASIGALILDIIFVFNINTFESVTINGTEYHKGTEQYLVEINKLKKSFAFSGIVAMFVGIFSTRNIYKRNKKKITNRFSQRK